MQKNICDKTYLSSSINRQAGLLKGWLFKFRHVGRYQIFHRSCM